MTSTTGNRVWSTQQQAIFAWFKGTTGNLVVRARAGTGKTTTILEAISFAPETRILLAAFNKKIAEELKTKLRNPNAEAKTLHGVGFAFVLRNWNGVRLDETRGSRLAKQALGTDAPDPMVSLVAKLAAKGKAMLPSSIQEMTNIAYDFNLEPDEEWLEDGWTVDRLAKAALKAMELAATSRDGTIDFDDMIYVPVANNWVRPRYDLVVIDEAQDMNAAQLKLARGCCTKTGRIVVVGDDRQAIYGFRGADSGSLDRLKTELKATELGLTVTYRCPKVVVAYAQKLVPDYQAAPEAPEGKLETLAEELLVDAVNPGDFLLSRKNAPLVKHCLSFLRAGKRAKVEGRDIGRTIVAVVRGLKARSIPELMERLGKWEQKQVTRARKAARTEEAGDAKAQEINDQAETIRVLATDMVGVPELQKRIEDLFADGVGASFIICMSIHRSKGRETENVFLLADTLYPGKRKDIEEQNIDYVGSTRAKARLVMVKKAPEASKVLEAR